MKTKTEPYRPVHDGIKSKTSNFRPDAEPTKSEPYYIKESDYRDVCGVHQLALQYLQKIAVDFAKLNLSKLTMPELQIFATRDFKNTRNRYFQNIEADISKLQLGSDIIKENMRVGTAEVFKEFENKTMQNLDNFQRLDFSSGRYHHLSVSNYTIQNGEVLFTDDNRKNIKDVFCTIYIDLPVKERFVQIQEEVFKGLKELKVMLIENHVGSLFSVPGDPGLYDEDGTEVFSDKEFVQYIEK